MVVCVCDREHWMCVRVSESVKGDAGVIVSECVNASVRACVCESALDRSLVLCV